MKRVERRMGVDALRAHDELEETLQMTRCRDRSMFHKYKNVVLMKTGDGFKIIFFLVQIRAVSSGLTNSEYISLVPIQ